MSVLVYSAWNCLHSSPLMFQSSLSVLWMCTRQMPTTRKPEIQSFAEMINSNITTSMQEVITESQLLLSALSCLDLKHSIRYKSLKVLMYIYTMKSNYDVRLAQDKHASTHRWKTFTLSRVWCCLKFITIRWLHKNPTTQVQSTFKSDSRSVTWKSVRTKGQLRISTQGTHFTCFIKRFWSKK